MTRPQDDSITHAMRSEAMQSSGDEMQYRCMVFNSTLYLPKMPKELSEGLPLHVASHVEACGMGIDDDVMDRLEDDHACRIHGSNALIRLYIWPLRGCSRV
jgi:hypothetical protein